MGSCEFMALFFLVSSFRKSARCCTESFKYDAAWTFSSNTLTDWVISPIYLPSSPAIVIVINININIHIYIQESNPSFHGRPCNTGGNSKRTLLTPSQEKGARTTEIHPISPDGRPTPQYFEQDK